MEWKGLFQKQKMMRTVLIALLPVCLASVYFFGWRPMLTLAFAVVTAVLAEYLVMRGIQKEKTRVSEAALVSAVLFTLTLPPAVPVWIAVLGMAFGIVFGKAAFGGFGKNIFNPALVGRCFIYIAFPAQMTLQWAQPYTGLPGGFAHWLPLQAADTVSSATPLLDLVRTGALAPLKDLFLGSVAGSLGETSALLLLMMGAYLVYTKVASYEIMLSTLLSGLVLSGALYYAGASAIPPLFFVLSGGYMLGAVFMATDPVSAPKNKTAQWLYGVLIGVSTVVIRVFGLFTEGMMFAILIANALTPLMELKLKQLADRKKAGAAKEAAV